MCYLRAFFGAISRGFVHFLTANGCRSAMKQRIPGNTAEECRCREFTLQYALARDNSAQWGRGAGNGVGLHGFGMILFRVVVHSCNWPDELGFNRAPGSATGYSRRSSCPRRHARRVRAARPSRRGQPDATFREQRPERRCGRWSARRACRLEAE